MNVRRSIVIATVVSLAACGDDGPKKTDATTSTDATTTSPDTTEADATTAPDTTTTAPDVDPDSGPDVDPDVEPDTGSDVEPDVDPDVEPDTGSDVEPDVIEPDPTCTALGITPIMFAPDADDPRSFVVHGRFPTADPQLVSSCGTSLSEVVIGFVPPSDGLWELSTEGPATTADTLVDVRATCEDASTITCDALGAGAHGARVTVDVVAGAQTIVVIAATTDAVTWQLIARPVVSLAAAGEPCGEDIACASGTRCITGLAAPVCRGRDIPTIDSVTTRWLNENEAVHHVTGSDDDGDPRSVWLVGAESAQGEVYGDEDGEVPVELEPGFTVDLEAGTWALDLDMPVGYLLFFVSAIVEADIIVVDAQSHASTPFHISYAAPTEVVDVALGEACDTTGYPRRCTEGVCVDTCVEATAPLITAATLAAGPGDDLVIHVTGSDTTRDAIAIALTVTYDDSSTRDTTWYFDDPGTAWQGDTFDAVRVGALPYHPTAAPTGVSITVRDDAELSSEGFELPWPPTPHTTLGEGAACDPAAPTASCELGLVCGGDLFGGLSCGAEVAPELYAASLSVNPDTGFIEVVVEGSDANHDVAGLSLAFTNADGLARVDVDAFELTPRPVTYYFSTRAVLEDPIDPSAFAYLRVELVDATRRSSTMLVPLHPELEAGATCDPGAPSDVCALADQACGLGATCEAAVAPTLTGLVVRRVSEGDIAVELTGSDVNGDATDVQVTVTVDGDEQAIDPPFVRPTPAVFGAESFSGTVQLAGWGFAGDTLAVTLRVRDLTDRLSGALTVAVPPIVALEGACSGDDTIDRCADGSSCTDGVCTEHAPVVHTVTTAPTNAGRDLVITIAGSDADRVLDEAALTFTGGGDDRTEHLLIGDAYGIAHTITWDGSDFTLEVAWPQWGDVVTAPRTGVEVVITDAAGTESEPVTGAITPVRNLGESCDAASRCQAGLMCDEGACATNEADPCGGGVWAEATALGTWSGDSLVAALTLTGEGVDASYCPAAPWAHAAGPEHYVRLVPDRSGALSIQSVTAGADAVWVRVTEGQCVVPDAPMACAQHDDAVTVEATQGEPLYIQVDAYTLDLGLIELHLTWLPVPVP